MLYLSLISRAKCYINSQFSHKFTWLEESQMYRRNRK